MRGCSASAQAGIRKARLPDARIMARLKPKATGKKAG
jgi:hypothetical protein